MFIADKDIKEAYERMGNCGCDPDMKSTKIVTNASMEWWSIRCDRCHKDTGALKTLNQAIIAWNAELIH